MNKMIFASVLLFGFSFLANAELPTRFECQPTGGLSNGPSFQAPLQPARGMVAAIDRVVAEPYRVNYRALCAESGDRTCEISMHVDYKKNDTWIYVGFFSSNARNLTFSLKQPDMSLSCRLL